jgi:steroid 5-alpha reductase family enzyme
VLWWSYPIIAIGNLQPFGWLALAAPAFMFWLLVYVSGIPPLERALLQSRGDAYRRYQARVPAFLPFFPNSKTAPDSTRFS